MGDRRWLAHYDSDVARSLEPYPSRTLVEYLRQLSHDRPSAPALLFKGATITYRQLDDDSNAIARALHDSGVRKGDRVALVLPNCPQFIVAEFAAWKLGAVVVPLNPTYSERELEHALSATGAGTVVCLTLFYAKITSVQAGTSVRQVIATSIKDYLPLHLKWLFTLFKERREGHRVSLDAGDHAFADLLAGHRGLAPPPVEVTGDDQAVILSSGGTTGTPKGVVGRHHDYVCAGLQLHEWTKSAKRPWTDVIMLPLPLFHVYANVGVQPLAFVSPNPVSLVPNPRDIADLLATIKKVRPTFFNGVPTLYNAILNHPDVRSGRVDLRSIKICFSGAAALMAETKRRFEQLTGARIVEGYSLTEGMMACCVNPVQGVNKLGSIGIPLPDVEVRIVDAEDGIADVGVDEVGEMILRAPQRMAEYWNNPAETAHTLRTNGDGAPWVYTGDLARMDTDGFVFIVDRKKDMLKTSGYQVWPREIEEVIASHPAVLEVGVAGVPDPDKGEVAHAWIVLRPEHAATVEELRTYCKERLAPYKVPARFEFRTELPKTMVGKVLRRALTADRQP